MAKRKEIRPMNGKPLNGKPQEITVEFERFTCGLAQKALDNMIKNRPVDHTRVGVMCDMVRNNEWEEYNGDTVKFSPVGQLLDGQHRMHMVLRMGKPMEFLVARGVPEKAFSTIDQIKPRSLGQLFSIAGEKSYTHLASAVRTFHMLSLGKSLGLTRSMRLTPGAAFKLLKKHPELRTAVSFGYEADARSVMGLGAFAGAYYACSLKDKKLAEDFFWSLGTGENLLREDNVYKLRKRFLQEQASLEKINRMSRLSLLIKVWNAERSGEKIEQLHLTKADTDSVIK